MIEVTFLGVGAAIPAPGQTNCAYLVSAAGANLLIDCGPAILQQLAAAGRSPLDVTHVFVSHAHGDHHLGYPMFLLYWGLESREGPPRAPPTVVASSTTWRALRVLWEHSYNDAPAYPVIPVELPTDVPAAHALTPDITLTTFPLAHSTVAPVLGVRVEVEGKVLAFTADTARCDNVVPLAQGADLLVHDARHGATVAPMRTTQSRFHCCARDAGEYANLAGAKRLALVHIGAEFAGRHGELVAEAQAAYAGEVFAPAAGEVVRL
jgi:ribonuclease Z